MRVPGSFLIETSNTEQTLLWKIHYEETRKSIAFRKLEKKSNQSSLLLPAQEVITKNIYRLQDLPYNIINKVIKCKKNHFCLTIIFK